MEEVIHAPFIGNAHLQVPQSILEVNEAGYECLQSLEILPLEGLEFLCDASSTVTKSVRYGTYLPASSLSRLHLGISATCRSFSVRTTHNCIFFSLKLFLLSQAYQGPRYSTSDIRRYGSRTALHPGHETPQLRAHGSAIPFSVELRVFVSIPRLTT